MGREWGAPKVVLTTGTFLKGMIHIGDKRIPGGQARRETGNWLV